MTVTVSPNLTRKAFAIAAIALAFSSVAVAACPVRLCIYQDEQENDPWVSLGYSWDPGQVPISSLTPDGAATIGDLVFKPADPALGVPLWDFRPVNGLSNLKVRAQTTAECPPGNPTCPETCNWGWCGYVDGTTISRDDPVAPDHVTMTGAPQVAAFLAEPAQGEHWLLTGTQDEGSALESNLCTDGVTSPRVPQERYSNLDGTRLYFTLDDSWQSDLFDCFRNIFALGTCHAALFTQYTTPVGFEYGHTGRISNRVVADGVSILPSGHWLDTLVVRNLTDFGVSSGLLNCITAFRDIRQFRYAFYSPRLSSAIIITSVESVPAGSDPDGTRWTQTEATGTFFQYGLLPPLSIGASATGSGEVTVTWDPGNVPAAAIDRFRVYWDTDSGDPYQNHIDTADSTARSAVVSGLTDGTKYYFTVTALKFYPHKTAGRQLYESLVFPKQIGSQAGPTPHLYPVEVAVTPGGGPCIPATEVAPSGGPAFLTVRKAGADFTLEWPAVSGEPCLQNYAILASATGPASFGSFSVLRTSASTTDTGALPAASLVSLLIAVRGPSGDLGPAGHCEETASCP